MKSKIWNLVVLTVILLSVGSFFYLFDDHQTDPKLGSIPFVFWTGLLVTTLVVLLTFVGSRVFPHEESKKA